MSTNPPSTPEKPEQEAKQEQNDAFFEDEPIITASQSPHLSGWRLWLTTSAIMLATFLVNIEVSIVGTSLITIANSLHRFSETSWIVTGYLVTYTGFMIIWSKLSDVIGRKITFITTMFLFVVFSGGCGASQTLTQLTINRVFQGVGAAGTYSLAVVILFEMVPPSKYAAYSGGSVAVVSVANVLGPIVGGLINNNGSWRWAFLFIVPFGVIAIGLMMIAFPARRLNQNTGSVSGLLKWANLGRLDFLGATLLLAASMLLVTALLEASIRFGWNAGGTIALLVLSGCCWIGFLVWERFVTKRQRPEPIFPWTFFSNLTFLGMLLMTFMVGVPFNALIVNMPQRFQALDDKTALGAGIWLLPYTVVSPVCSVISNIVASKARVPLIYLLLTGAVCHLVGVTLLSTLNGIDFPSAGLGYEAIAGAGVGITFSILVLGTPFVVNPRDIAVATGAIVQLRFLGGAIGVAITSAYMNSYLKSSLANILSPDTLSAILQDTSVIKGLTPQLQEDVKRTFAHGYATQIRILIGFTAAQLLSIGLIWRKKQIKVP
ncbi:putative efflux pump antibiotic resistance protein [Annulohypoxylon moriforme]|nr:putative efflux pump antibiotic resistance protein [Annulohypoxylon moriforme]